MVKVSSYIQNAFSMEDAKRLLPIIEDMLSCENKIVLDFSGINFFTTLFFNNAITRFVLSLGPQKYEETFTLINLSNVGKTTYEHSLENAISYYNIPNEKRIEADHIISETLRDSLE